jgi:hypothetical protein
MDILLFFLCKNLAGRFTLRTCVEKATKVKHQSFIYYQGGYVSMYHFDGSVVVT